MTPTMVGQTIDRVEQVLYYVELRTTAGGLLTIENDFTLERAGQPDVRTHDVEDEPIVDALRALLPAEVRTMDTAGGRLIVGLGPATIVVQAHPRFESWDYIGPDKERVISTPGGELAIWDAPA